MARVAGSERGGLGGMGGWEALLFGAYLGGERQAKRSKVSSAQSFTN